MKMLSYLAFISLTATTTLASHNPIFSPSTPQTTKVIPCPDMTQRIIQNTPGMNQSLPLNGRIQTGNIAIRQQKGYPINPPLGQIIQFSEGKYQIVNFMVYDNAMSGSSKTLADIMNAKNQQKLKFWRIMNDWDLNDRPVCIYMDMSGDQGYLVSLLPLS